MNHTLRKMDRSTPNNNNDWRNLDHYKAQSL